jgi:hypothetical protein
MHEVGHNLGMGHSSEIGEEYGDEAYFIIIIKYTF